jgi:cytochrome c oxidase assembly factor CtaG
VSEPVPTWSALLTAWAGVSATTVLCAALSIVAIAGYLTAVRRAPGWPVARTVSFLLGVALFAWTTCGFPQAYAGSLYWVWTVQALVLLLAVPVLVLLGRPVELVTGRGPRSTGPLSNPLLGPAVLPLLCALLLFGPLPGWAASNGGVHALVCVLTVAAGCLLTVGVLNIGRVGSSLAVGLAAAVLFVELLLDAIPGIVLRLHVSPASSFFVHRQLHVWSPPFLHDQQLGGAILWCVAESADLPILIAIFVAWVHADAREAREVDAVLAAERAARGALPAAPVTDEAQTGEADPVWWLSDPATRDRFGRG